MWLVHRNGGLSAQALAVDIELANAMIKHAQNYLARTGYSVLEPHPRACVRCGRVAQWLQSPSPQGDAGLDSPSWGWLGL